MTVFGLGGPGRRLGPDLDRHLARALRHERRAARAWGRGYDLMRHLTLVRMQRALDSLASEAKMLAAPMVFVSPRGDERRSAAAKIFQELPLTRTSEPLLGLHPSRNPEPETSTRLADRLHGESGRSVHLNVILGRACVRAGAALLLLCPRQTFSRARSSCKRGAGNVRVPPESR
jgi:hypothetical protein